VERVSEVSKIGNFFHWNVPQRKYVIDKSLPNKGFQWASSATKGIALLAFLARRMLSIAFEN